MFKIIGRWLIALWLNVSSTSYSNLKSIGQEILGRAIHSVIFSEIKRNRSLNFIRTFKWKCIEWSCANDSSIRSQRTSLNFIRGLVEKIFETRVNSRSRRRDRDENRSGFALQIPSGAPKLHLPREASRTDIASINPRLSRCWTDSARPTKNVALPIM